MLKDWILFFTVCFCFVAGGLTDQVKKIRCAKEEIQIIRDALQSYYIDFGMFPTAQQGLSVLWNKGERETELSGSSGGYITKKIDKDPWGNSYQYFVKPDKSDWQDVPEGLPVAVVSWGADGKKGGSLLEKDIVSWRN